MFIFGQFRGEFADITELTLLSPRSGLVVEPGAKVTYNGVEIGRVGRIDMDNVDGTDQARLSLKVDPNYLKYIPANVDVQIQATTVFGNKYISFSSPENPSPERLSRHAVIDASAVTTEFNTLFETVTALAEQVDPIKLNQTLTATADALTGLGDRFGESLTNGNTIVEDFNARMPQFRDDTRLVADLADVYADASPDLFDGLQNAVTTARTFNDHRGDIDAGTDGRARLRRHRGRCPGTRHALPGPRRRGPRADLRNCSTSTAPRSTARSASSARCRRGWPGLSAATATRWQRRRGTFAGAGNPYIYPDNLPRVNARGGPEGRPGCWQDITRDLFPAPFLVMDTGASIAPYNHIELGQPMFIEYVWGRQIGENTINP